MEMKDLLRVIWWAREFYLSNQMLEYSTGIMQPQDLFMMLDVHKYIVCYVNLISFLMLNVPVHHELFEDAERTNTFKRLSLYLWLYEIPDRKIEWVISLNIRFLFDTPSLTSKSREPLPMWQAICCQITFKSNA